jgi:hypothetical protein
MKAGEPDSYDAFAQHIGIEMLGIQEGRAQARLRIQDYHLNRHGILHGAVLFALADLVLAAASNSYGPAAVSIQATISYLKAISRLLSHRRRLLRIPLIILAGYLTHRSSFQKCLAVYLFFM